MVDSESLLEGVVGSGKSRERMWFLKRQISRLWMKMKRSVLFSSPGYSPPVNEPEHTNRMEREGCR